MDSANASGSKEPHLLNLKVMRLSRPNLSKAAPPFFLDPIPDSETALNQLRRAELRQSDLQPQSLGAQEISSVDHPSTTFRDFPISPMLSLPNSFGTISLGETFTATLCLSNDSSVPVGGVKMTASMQSNTQTVIIATKEPGSKVAGGKSVLGWEETMELLVTWEMREVGVHVLQVNVDYESSSGPRQLQKFYKFSVTAPLNIKTKCHLPTSPNALLSPQSRDLVFLEVHIQNISTASMVFEKVEMEPVPGLRLVRLPNPKTISEEDVPPSVDQNLALFHGPTKALQPQDTRQLLFVLAPIESAPFPKASLFPSSHPPGTVVPLGRLDLTWRGPFGERGQLLTSVLSRRVPLLAPSLQPASTSIAAAPSRTASAMAPQAQQRATSAMGYQPPSALGPNSPARPTSAATMPAPPPPPKSRDADLEVDLTVIKCERTSVPSWEQMEMTLRIAVGQPVGKGLSPPQKVLNLAIQYLQLVYQDNEPTPTPTVPGTPMSPGAAFSSPNFASNQFQAALSPPSRSMTPISMRAPTPSIQSLTRVPSAASIRPATPVQEVPPAPPAVQRFPPLPVLNIPTPPPNDPLAGGIKQSGMSMIYLPPLLLQPLQIASVVRDESPRQSLDGSGPMLPPPPPRHDPRLEGFAEFGLRFMPTKAGLAKFGGLRVIRLEDPEDVTKGGEIVKEWVTLGDVWVEG